MLSLISCRSDTFRRREPRSTNNQIMPQLLDAACTQENHQKTKEIPRVPRHNFLYSCSSCLQSCEFKALMAGVCALIDKDPLPHSGAQSVSRWLLWNSTGYGPSKYMCQIALPTSGERDTRLNAWTERASLNVYHTSSLAARLLLSTFSASAVGIIRQIRQYVRRYVRNQTRVK